MKINDRDHSFREEDWPTQGKVFATRADGSMVRCVTRVSSFVQGLRWVTMAAGGYALILYFDGVNGFGNSEPWLYYVTMALLLLQVLALATVKQNLLYLEIFEDEIALVEMKRGTRRNVIRTMARKDIQEIHVRSQDFTNIQIHGANKERILLSEHKMNYGMVVKCGSRLAELFDVPFVNAKGENLKVSLDPPAEEPAPELSASNA